MPRSRRPDRKCSCVCAGWTLTSLKAAIGEYVDEREIKALLERRDRILKLSGAKAGS